MQTQPPPLNRQTVDALRASALRWLTWLARVIASIGLHARGKRLVSWVRTMEREVEYILFLEAVLRHGLPLTPPCRRPRAAAPGFRRTRRTLRLFFKRCGVSVRGRDLLARVWALFAALARPERHIAYFMKRLCKGLRRTSLVIAAPPAWALADGAPAPAAIADSS